VPCPAAQPTLLLAFFGPATVYERPVRCTPAYLSRLFHHCRHSFIPVHLYIETQDLRISKPKYNKKFDNPYEKGKIFRQATLHDACLVPTVPVQLKLYLLVPWQFSEKGSAHHFQTLLAHNTDATCTPKSILRADTEHSSAPAGELGESNCSVRVNGQFGGKQSAQN
jgi:hypothetical protein